MKFSHLVEEIDFVDVALVHQHAQVLPWSVDVYTLELSCLVLGSLIAVEAEIPKPSEVRRLVRIPVTDKQLDLSGDLALM